MAVRVQPSHGYVQREPPHKEVWLLVEWPEDEKEPTKYFLCDLPKTYTFRRLVRLAKARWKIEQDYQQMKEELGLDYYEGRNWEGWHHHGTLVMMAQAFLTVETLRNKKTSGRTLPRTRREIQCVPLCGAGNPEGRGRNSRALQALEGVCWLGRYATVRYCLIPILRKLAHGITANIATVQMSVDFQQPIQIQLLVDEPKQLVKTAFVHVVSS